MKTIYLFTLLFALSLTSCKIADLSQPSTLAIDASEAKATSLLDATIEAQGFAVMAEENVYSFRATDDWRGLLGKMVKLWPDNSTTFEFKHNFNTFDGTGLFLNGQREGDKIGVQSWHYYEESPMGSSPQVIDTGDKLNPLEFGMVIYHYFIELPYRLRQAPIRRYYGQRTWKGVTYDLVFATWGEEAAHPEHDQYLLYINPETKLVDYSVYTLRDNTSPFTRHKYGSIAYQGYQNIDGFMAPTKLPVLLDDGVVRKKSLDRYFHQLTVHEFSFGGFPEEELYPLPRVEKQIDTKPE